MILVPSCERPSGFPEGEEKLSVTVEENPRLCGWGAEISSLVAEELFWDLEGPIVRVTTPHIPLPSADALEDSVLPSPEKIVDAVVKLAD